MKRLLAPSLAFALLWSGCGSDAIMKAAPPGTSTGNPADAATPDSGNVTDQDAGNAGTDEDAGAALVRTRECARINPLDAVDEDRLPESRASGVSVPTDFQVTRALTTWRGGCADPEILIELSDGRCPDGKGHKIQFFISTRAIADGRIVLRDNTVSPDADARGFRVRYTRPDGIAPSGVWGTCRGASGVITLPKLLEVKKRSDLYGTFQLTLTDCAEAPALGPMEINGRFNEPLYRGLADYCPDSTTK